MATRTSARACRARRAGPSAKENLDSMSLIRLGLCRILSATWSVDGRFRSAVRSSAGASVAAALTLGPVTVAGAGQPARPDAPAGAAYAAGITTWRSDYETDLRREDGWLSVAGLFFLAPGPNAFGSGPSNDIVLPGGAAPERAGTLTLKDGRVFVELTANVEGALNGQPVTRGELRPASADPRRAADVLRFGRLSLLLHRSGSRLAVRLRDPDGPVRRTFTGTRWFPVDRRWRLVATFVPFDAPRSVRIVNILGDEVELKSPGTVRFRWGGQPRSLLALSDGDELWFVFSDKTAGTSTYEAARFLYAPQPVNGQVVLDFNKAYNPPCAYNPFTTCPLPPRENRLDIAVTAGEKAYPSRWEPR